MATEKILNTRIQLKYDSLENWASKNPTLKSGELAIAYLPPKGNGAAPDASTNAVLFKVGPGEFNTLPWASALAADVYTWAKKSEADFTAWVKTLVAPSDINAYTKGEVDNLLSNSSKADQKYVDDTIAGLDVEDEAVSGEYVSAVSEVDGKISVSRATLPTYTLVEGSANGTVSFNGTDVAVHGLGSAAYTNTNAYATAAQGAKADSAVQKVTILGKELTNGGALTVAEGKSALGLGSAAYADTNAFDAAGAASAVQGNLDSYVNAHANDYTNVKIDELIQDAKDYADTNDANTEYHIEYDSTNKLIKLVAGANASKMTIDATNFIKDGMISNVELNSDHDLVITFNTDAGQSDIVVPLDELIDVYTGIEGDRIAIDVSSDNKISADLVAGSISKSYLDSGVQGSLNKADSAIQSVSIGTGAANGQIKLTVDGVDTSASVYGLGSAAYTASTAYATAAQGAKADTALQPAALNDYYTKSEADGAFMDATETGNAIDAKIAALKLAETYEPIGAETRAKNYADGLAGNYATAAQGTKADNALQTIEAGTGLKVSTKSGNKQTISFDDDVVFVFNCGSASELVD